MSVTHLPNAHYTSLLSAQENHLIGYDVDWLNKLRKKASKTFSATGFPTFREEEWRYTNISPIEKKQFTVSEQAGKIDAAFVKIGRASCRERV